MKKLSVLAFAIAAATAGVAHASEIKVEAAQGSTGFLASGDAYLAAVDALLLDASYVSAMPASLDSYNHQGLFGGNGYFGMKTVVNFGVAAAGDWSFRAGVDFGIGGAMFLDGLAVDFKSNDMWWNGSYSDASQYFAANATLGAGNHVLTIVGFESCCDGGQQVQFKSSPNAAFTSFATTDGLNVARDVPEPASLALAAAGLGLLGLSRRRKAAARQA